MSNKALLEESANSFETEDTEQPLPPADIVAYNELRSCADLFRMYASKKLDIQPDFQREVVWKQDDQTRFIDSLVKQLPIPSMCFSLDYQTQRWKVIDGLQRMSSIINFLSEKEWKLKDLQDIHPMLRGTSNKQIREGNPEQKRIYELVEDVSIPVTVIRCDYTKKSHMLYLFTIFHRLNSGGVRLTNQEIRNCIYSGMFNDTLKSFDKTNTHWLSVKKRIWGSMDRFRSIEVLLRVLAFTDRHGSYDGNLARFLNDYMHAKSLEPREEIEKIIPPLTRGLEIASKILANEPQKKLPLLFIEALLVALTINGQELIQKSDTEILSMYNTMKNNPSFAEGARYAVSNAENVRARLNSAISAFPV